MAGTKEGAQKAKQSNIQRDPDFYRKIGSQSWKSARSHKVGFALLDKETHRKISSKGGKKTKNDYKTEQETINAVKNLEIDAASQAYKTSTGTSE